MAFLKWTSVLLGAGVIFGGCVGILKSYDLRSVALTRTICFGYCPDYTLTLYRNGFATFRGGGVVIRPVTRERIVNRDNIDYVFAVADEIGFSNLPNNIDDHCPAFIVDTPGAEIALSGTFGVRRVRVETCALLTRGWRSISDTLIALGRLTQEEVDTLLEADAQARDYLRRFHRLASAIDSAVSRDDLIRRNAYQPELFE